MQGKYESFLNRFGIIILIVAGLTFFGFFLLKSNNTTQENNGYLRVINCVSTVPGSQRTANDIEKCYQSVENDLNVTLQRYNKNPR